MKDLLAMIGAIAARKREWTEVGADRLEALLAAPSPPVLLDVRSPEQYAAGHLPGARNLPLDRLPTAAEGLERDRPVVVY